MKLKYEVDIEIPTVPNFLIIKDSDGYSRTEGPKKVSVKDITPEQLTEVANEWKRQLLAKVGVVLK